MNEQSKDQIFQLLSNIEESKKVIATFSDMCNHPLLWARFSAMKWKEKTEIQECINEYVKMRKDNLSIEEIREILIQLNESLKLMNNNFISLLK